MKPSEGHILACSRGYRRVWRVRPILCFRQTCGISIVHIICVLNVKICSPDLPLFPFLLSLQQRSAVIVLVHSRRCQRDMEPTRDLLGMYFSALFRSSNIKSVVLIVDNANTSSRRHVPVAIEVTVTIEQHPSPRSSGSQSASCDAFGNCHFHQVIVPPTSHIMNRSPRRGLVLETRTE